MSWADSVPQTQPTANWADSIITGSTDASLWVADQRKQSSQSKPQPTKSQKKQQSKAVPTQKTSWAQILKKRTEEDALKQQEPPSTGSSYAVPSKQPEEKQQESWPFDKSVTSSPKPPIERMQQIGNISSASASPRHLEKAIVATEIEPSAAVPPGLHQNESRPHQPVRKLKQDQPVIMPSTTNKTALGVQFGSLKIGDLPLEKPQQSAGGIASLQQQSVVVEPQQEPQVKQASARDPRIPTAPSPATTKLEASNGISQNEPNNNNNSIPGTAGVLHYGSYFPNQHAAAFGIGPLAGMPAEYGVYGSEQARAAAAMGYYPTDPSYGAPGMAGSKYLATDAAPPASQSPQHIASIPSMPNAAAQPTQTQNQQAFHAPYGYYPYYMPNQFPSAYQNANVYGQQQYVGKSVYPGFAQGQSATTNANQALGGSKPAIQQGQGLASTNTSIPPSSVANLSNAGYPYTSMGAQPNFYHIHDDVSSIQGSGMPMDYPKNTYNSGGFNANGKNSDYKNRSSRQQYDSQKYGQQQQQGGNHGNQNNVQSGGQPSNSLGNNQSGHSAPTGQPHSGMPQYYNQHQFATPHHAYQPHMMHQYPNGYSNSGAGGQRHGYWQT